MIIIGYFYERWYFKVYFYNLTDDFVVIRKNPITPREIVLPYNRIQDISIRQDLLDRFFGLYNLSLSSATVSSTAEAYISGLEKANAEALLNELINRVKNKNT